MSLHKIDIKIRVLMISEVEIFTELPIKRL